MDIALKWSSNNKDDDFDNENVIFFNFFLNRTFGSLQYCLKNL